MADTNPNTATGVQNTANQLNASQSQQKKPLFWGAQEVFDNLEKFERISNPTDDNNFDFDFSDTQSNESPEDNAIPEATGAEKINPDEERPLEPVQFKDTGFEEQDDNIGDSEQEQGGEENEAHNFDFNFLGENSGDKENNLDSDQKDESFEEDSELIGDKNDVVLDHDDNSSPKKENGGNSLDKEVIGNDIEEGDNEDIRQNTNEFDYDLGNMDDQSEADGKDENSNENIIEDDEITTENISSENEQFLNEENDDDDEDDEDDDENDDEDDDELEEETEENNEGLDDDQEYNNQEGFSIEDDEENSNISDDNHIDNNDEEQPHNEGFEEEEEEENDDEENDEEGDKDVDEDEDTDENKETDTDNDDTQNGEDYDSLDEDIQNKMEEDNKEELNSNLDQDDLFNEDENKEGGNINNEELIEDYESANEENIEEGEDQEEENEEDDENKEDDEDEDESDEDDENEDDENEDEDEIATEDVEEVDENGDYNYEEGRSEIEVEDEDEDEDEDEEENEEIDEGSQEEINAAEQEASLEMETYDDENLTPLMKDYKQLLRLASTILKNEKKINKDDSIDCFEIIGNDTEKTMVRYRTSLQSEEIPILKIERIEKDYATELETQHDLEFTSETETENLITKIDGFKLYEEVIDLQDVVKQIQVRDKLKKFIFLFEEKLKDQEDQIAEIKAQKEKMKAFRDIFRNF